MKQHYLALLIAISVLFGYQQSSAQFNSVARVSAGEDRSLCGTSCFDLTASLTDIRATDNYIIDSSIDFNSHYPFYIPGSSSIHAENNVFSEAIALPFNFCFYGRTYGQVVIGSNGIISFDEESIGKRCDPITKKEIPSRAYAYAAIMPAYQALDLSLGGSIYYSVEGNAPNRKFIVNYNNIPLRTCSIDNATFQVVLYETTNVIELYLKDKPSCIYYYDGAGIAGIQKNQKEALALPGKNASRWGSTGMNAAYRFIPWGDAAAQTVQLSDISGKVLASVQASTLENGQLSASFGNICIQEGGSQYVVSTIFKTCGAENICADTIYVSKHPDCGSGDKHPVTAVTEQPIRNEVTAVNNDVPAAMARREVNIGHVSVGNPTSCLGINGYINLRGLQANTEYKIEYTKNGVAQKAVKINSNAAGAVMIARLSAGTYTNIKASLDGASTTEAGPYTLTDPELPATPEPGNNGPVNPGEKLSLTVTNPDRVSYTWLGPGFAAVNNAPVILNAQPYNAGTYTVVATRNGCNSKPATTLVAVNHKGGIPDRTVPVRFNNYSKPVTPVRINPAIAAKPKPVISKPVAQVKTTPAVAARPRLTQSKPATVAKAMPVPAAKQKPFAQAKPAAIKKVYAGSNSPVKAGGTLKLHATSVAGATYSWNGPNDFSSNAQNPALNDINEKASGVYTVTVFSPSGIIKNSLVNVKVSGATKQVVQNTLANTQEPITENISAISVDPYVKNGSNGVIKLSGLSASTTYKVNYSKNGVPQPAKYFTTDASGTLLIMWLSVGNYEIYVSTLKGGRSNTISVTLKNPEVAKAYPQPIVKPVAQPAAKPVIAQTPKVAVKVAARERKPKAVVVSKPIAATKTAREEIEKPTEPAIADEEYKGILLSRDYTGIGESITVNYTDPIKNSTKIKWDFGGAEVVSGSGKGPYELRWKTAGIKTVSLTLPFNIPNFGNRLQKDIYVAEKQVTEEEVVSKEQEVTSQDAIRARHEAEEHPQSVATIQAVAPVAPAVVPNTQPVAVHTEPIRKQIPVEPPTIEENITASRSNVCLNDTATISFDGYITDAAELNWDFADATIVSGTGAGPYVVRWDEDGSKNVKLTVSYGSEKKTLYRSINIKPAPKADFLLQADACPGETVAVEINRDKDRSETHSWDFDGADVMSGDDGGPYEVKWEEPGKKVVSLTVVDAGGCTSLPYREIINVHNDCCGISLPNAFTPNGDGKNDMFRAVSVGPHIILRFVVYNRFGREIFTTNNEGEGWDGTLDGTPQEIGTYFYKVRYRCGEKLYEKEGEVMLLR